MIDVNKNTTKVAIYCRLSEEDKNKTNKYDDSNSIKNQKALLIEYCINNDWETYNIYSDDDYSGGIPNPSQYKRSKGLNYKNGTQDNKISLWE